MIYERLTNAYPMDAIGFEGALIGIDLETFNSEDIPTDVMQQLLPHFVGIQNDGFSNWRLYNCGSWNKYGRLATFINALNKECVGVFVGELFG